MATFIKDNQSETECIWVFNVSRKSINYVIIDKSKVDYKNTWAFDYFTQESLLHKPISGMRFEIENTITTRAWSNQCVESFIGSEINGVYYETSLGYHCWSSWNDEIEHIAIDDGPGGGGGGGDFPTGGGGGGGNASTGLSKELKVFYKGKISLEPKDIEKLNKAFEDMLEECFYNTINDYLLANNVRLRNISIDSNYGGQAGISNLGDLTFSNSDEITEANLSHEWIHQFQKVINDMTTFGDRTGMF